MGVKPVTFPGIYGYMAISRDIVIGDSSRTKEAGIYLKRTQLRSTKQAAT